MSCFRSRCKGSCTTFCRRSRFSFGMENIEQVNEPNYEKYRPGLSGQFGGLIFNKGNILGMPYIPPKLLRLENYEFFSCVDEAVA